MKKALRILLIIVVILALVVAGGFAYLYSNGMSGMSNTTEAKAGQIKIACVGDSITYVTAPPIGPTTPTPPHWLPCWVKTTM